MLSAIKTTLTGNSASSGNAVGKHTTVYLSALLYIATVKNISGKPRSVDFNNKLRKT